MIKYATQEKSVLEKQVQTLKGKLRARALELRHLLTGMAYSRITRETTGSFPGPFHKLIEIS